jgi:hypothetical protein
MRKFNINQSNTQHSRTGVNATLTVFVRYTVLTVSLGVRLHGLEIAREGHLLQCITVREDVVDGLYDGVGGRVRGREGWVGSMCQDSEKSRA